MNFKFESQPGDHFSRVAEKAKLIANQREVTVEFEFNSVVCLVNSDTELDYLYRDYSNSWTMEWKSVGPNCLQQYSEETQKELHSRSVAKEIEAEKRRQECAKKEKMERDAFNALVDCIDLAILPEKVEEYAAYVQKNSQDGYSRAVIDFAEGWAKIMQKMMVKEGLSVADVADPAQNGLGFFGITGFQYGAAVNGLAHFWIYGEALRKWHNKKWGASENAEGTVNPAILTLKG